MSDEKRYVDIDGCIYGVKKFNKDKQFKKGFAYIKGRYVLPFRGPLEKKSRKPGIYMCDEGLIVLRPISKKKIKKYSIDKIYTIGDVNRINSLIIKEGVRSEDLGNILGESDEIFAPPILDQDNTLQILIKRALGKKEIDINNYAGRFTSTSDLNNHKRSLFHHGKMSYEKFIKWCEALDLEYEIIVKDAPYSLHPMNDEIHYKSK